MCKNCGCGGGSHHHHHSHGDGDDHHHHHHDADGGEEHVHYDAAGNPYSHRHEASGTVIPLEQAVLAANDDVAEANRAWFRERGITALNLISSPGSGKTTLLVKTLDALREAGVPTAVIVGDQYGDVDAERMRNHGATVTQIETHDSCHLSAEQIRAVLEDAVPAGIRLVLIENVGNLVCPVAFDLGEEAKIALLSTPEGEEKPIKYPGLFAVASLVLLTKVDLASVLEWNRELCLANLRTVNPEAEILEVSARTGNGFAAWVDYLKCSVKKSKTLE